MEPQVITVTWHYPKTKSNICECLQGCHSASEFRPLKRLIRKRESMGLTQKQMAKRYRVSQPFYCAIERGAKLCPDRILNGLKIKGQLQYRGINV